MEYEAPSTDISRYDDHGKMMSSTINPLLKVMEDGAPIGGFGVGQTRAGTSAEYDASDSTSPVGVECDFVYKLGDEYEYDGQPVMKLSEDKAGWVPRDSQHWRRVPAENPVIKGVVNANYEAVITVPVRGPEGQAPASGGRGGHRFQPLSHLASSATPLIGMLLLDDHDLSIQVRDGGRVVIQAGQ